MENTATVSGKTSKVTTNIDGATTTIDNGVMTTSASVFNTGYSIQGLVTIKENATVSTTIVKTSDTNASVILIGDTMSSATPYNPGTISIIKVDSGSLYIETKTVLTDNLIVK